MRALVTGGRGFVASWLAKALLESGSEVTSIDRPGGSPTGLELHGIAGDVNDAVGDLGDYPLVLDLLRENRIDSVFHLAAQAIVGDANASPVPTFETNIAGTWVILEACREVGIECIVVASSDKAYGPHQDLPYTEDSPLQPVFPYDVSKAAADLVARSYWHTYGLPVAVTRMANIYGGGDHNFSRLIPETVTAVLAGRRPVIRSDGSPERDFLYVEDAVAAYLAIAEALAAGRGAGEAFNAGWERPHAVRPGHREPKRGDRAPVPRLRKGPRADRLGAGGGPPRGDRADPRVVCRPPGDQARRGGKLSSPGLSLRLGGRP